MRIAALAAVTVLVGLATPAAAGAHLRSGTVAVDYRASVSRSSEAVHVRVLTSDRAIQLTAQPGHSVVVLGYVGEPLIRIDAEGVAVNAASPSAVSTGLLHRGAQAESRTPVWRVASTRRSVVWHDARLSGLPPGVDRDTWSVPVTVDGSAARIHGELVRVPKPSSLFWVALAVLGATPILLLRRARTRKGAIALGIVAAVLSAALIAAFGFDAYASPGTRILGLDALACMAAGIGVIVWGPREWHAGAAMAIGLLAVTVGAANAEVFFHPIVLSVLPGLVSRVVDALTIDAGIAAAALGAASYVNVRGVRERAPARVT